ncbi:MAG TPA: 2-dehydropantoate 2-reductase N-terminal domain-containing protein, partial [Acidimicrobiales bacterium]|nr:2-dehydropantoate 2-reductase N-terminal domain-containing protein [Acidimicrobiales bacterium]
MRFIVYGAGAVGGVIGGRLFEAGHDVTLIARGDHLRALRRDGLTLASPDGTATLPVPAAADPGDAAPGDGDVVILTTKSQDTPGALEALAASAPPGIRLVCGQNGVENERLALRRFPHVYGMVVMLPATHLEPGVVVTHAAAPTTGLLDVGRYPAGVDAAARDIAAALEGATFGSEPRPDIMRWKYRKLVLNLGNAVEAVCGRDDRSRALYRLVRDEGEACLRAAGIDVASVDDDRARRREGRFEIRPVPGYERGGGSSWQSLARGLGRIETDYLTGEIVLLGRLHG